MFLILFLSHWRVSDFERVIRNAIETSPDREIVAIIDDRDEIEIISEDIRGKVTCIRLNEFIPENGANYFVIISCAELNQILLLQERMAERRCHYRMDRPLTDAFVP